MYPDLAASEAMTANAGAMRYAPARWATAMQNIIIAPPPLLY